MELAREAELRKAELTRVMAVASRAVHREASSIKEDGTVPFAQHKEEVWGFPLLLHSFDRGKLSLMPLVFFFLRALPRVFHAPPDLREEECECVVFSSQVRKDSNGFPPGRVLLSGPNRVSICFV